MYLAIFIVEGGYIDVELACYLGDKGFKLGLISSELLWVGVALFSLVWVLGVLAIRSSELIEDLFGGDAGGLETGASKGTNDWGLAGVLSNLTLGLGS